MSKVVCEGCDRDKLIVNKHFYLCKECNNKRLHGSKFGKQYTFKVKQNTSLRTSLKPKGDNNKLSHIADKGNKEKSTEIKINQNIVLDELFYLRCFQQSDHKCEECNVDLPTEFRDDEGRVIARWRYSHIIPKSIAPELRRDIRNINHLCIEDHQKWDFGTQEVRRSMKIYRKNQEQFPNYLKP